MAAGRCREQFRVVTAVTAAAWWIGNSAGADIWCLCITLSGKANHRHTGIKQRGIKRIAGNGLILGLSPAADVHASGQ